MARRRFYAPPDNIGGSMVTLSAHETHHLMHVLRMTPGDEAFVFDGSGREYRCSLRRVENNHAQLEISATLTDVVESPLDLTLAQALVRGGRSCRIVALVGPEGGWSDDEQDMLNAFGCRAVTLGPRVLRTETAAVVAITLIQNAMGDLSTRGTE